jgi:deoxyribodipyrimidine photo-lyase
LKAAGLQVESFNGALLHEPWTIANQSGRPFQVFTPFWRHCLKQPAPPPPLPTPAAIPSPEAWPRSATLAELQLLPRKPWDQGFRAAWNPGERGAAACLERFCQSGWRGYTENRNRPDLSGTSRLSPHLHFGEISPRQVLAGVAAHAARSGAADWMQQQFVTEVGWREFAHHLLYHFPQTPQMPLRAEFARFPWREDAAGLRAWQRGQTGYPIVDAGMRELWATGWMHNRVRMIVASFLVKDLMLPWQSGARWFWDTLVDADLAQNTLGWQWSASSGMDPRPLRIFNPTTQAAKFDPEATYIRRWLPELARVSTADLISGQIAPLERRGYPAPIVSHKLQQARFKAMYAALPRG